MNDDSDGEATGRKARPAGSLRQRLSGKGLAEAVRAERTARKRARRDSRPPRPDPPPDPRPAEGPDPIRGGAETAAPVHPDPGETQAEMIARLYKAFAEQMDQLEARLASLLPEGADVAAIDRTVKTLASLAKTLELLMELSKTTVEARDRDADQAVDPDALRLALARRLERLSGHGAD